MIAPGRRLLRLVAYGAPLWFLATLSSALWVPAAAWLLGLAALALHEALTRPTAEALEVQRELPGRLGYRERTWVKLHLANTWSESLHLTVRDEVPDALEATEQIFELKLGPGAQASIQYQVCPARRGCFEYGDVVVRLRHGRCLMEFEQRLKVPTTARVYPRFRGACDYQLLGRLAERHEARRPRRTRGQGSDYESLRPYVPGDDPRLVDWKSTARRGELVCRNPRVERGQQVALLIDSGRLMAGTIAGEPRLEHALRAAVRLSYVVYKRGDTMAMAAFSNRVEAFVPGLRGAAIMPAVLEACCGVEQRPVESDYWKVTAQILSRLRRRSLVVLFTEVLDAAASQGLLNNLRRAAARHLVLCVVMSEPRLAEAARMLPSTPAEAWRVAAACDLQRRRRLAREHMRSCGILVLESAPEHLSHHLINRYLRIRQEDLQ